MSFYYPWLNKASLDEELPDIDSNAVAKELTELEKIEERLKSIERLMPLIGSNTVKEYLDLQYKKRQILKTEEYNKWFDDNKNNILLFFNILTNFFIKNEYCLRRMKIPVENNKICLENIPKLDVDNLIILLNKYGYNVDYVRLGKEITSIEIYMEEN